MNRREFALLAAAAACTGAAARPRRKNFAWVTLEREQPADAWKRDFEAMRAAGLDGVIPEVYDGRHAYWGSSRHPVKAERLELLLPIAREAGLEVHAWMWCMPCMQPEILAKHPDWYNVNARGESAADKPAYVDYYRFLDPAHPEVRAFVRDTVRELAAIPGLTGVHLDYIRHPDAILPKGLWAKYGIVQDRVYPEYDYGYTVHSREVFKRKLGVDPLRLSGQEQHDAWLRYRLDSVTDLVNDYLVPAAHRGRKQVSAAVFPGPTLARQMVRQDWGRWKLDAFMPMLYHSFYEADASWVKAQTQEGVAAVRAPVYSGLFVPSVVAPGLAKVIEGALAGGAAGVTLFHAHAMDGPLWSAFAQAVAAS